MAAHRFLLALNGKLPTPQQHEAVVTLQHAAVDSTEITWQISRLAAVAALLTSTSPVPETRELVGDVRRTHMAVLCFEGLPGMTGLDELVWYGARVCLVAMFPFSAIEKVWHWKNALAQTASDRLPGAKPMLIMAIVVEFVTPICIVTGIYDRIAAFLLAGFCVVTAFLYHPFWAYPDFWAQSDSSQAREHFWQFLRILAWLVAYCLSSSQAISPRPRWYYARHLRLVGMQLAHRRSRPKRKRARGAAGSSVRGFSWSGLRRRPTCRRRMHSEDRRTGFEYPARAGARSVSK